MLTNGTVTIFQQSQRGGEFKRLGVFPCWVRHKARLQSNNRGPYLSDTFDVRIAHSCIKFITPGDLLYFGELSQKDFKPHICRRVAAVTENNFGTRPHWHIEAEIQYL